MLTLNCTGTTICLFEEDEGRRLKTLKLAERFDVHKHLLVVH